MSSNQLTGYNYNNIYNLFTYIQLSAGFGNHPKSRKYSIIYIVPGVTDRVKRDEG